MNPVLQSKFNSPSFENIDRSFDLYLQSQNGSNENMNDTTYDQTLPSLCENRNYSKIK